MLSPWVKRSYRFRNIHYQILLPALQTWWDLIRFKNYTWNVYARVDRPVIKHLSVQGRPYPMGGLCCFWCPNKTWTPPLGASDTLTIVKNRLEMRKLQPPKVKEGGWRTQKSKPSNITKADFGTLKKFFVCCSIAIRVQKWFVLQVMLL